MLSPREFMAMRTARKTIAPRLSPASDALDQVCPRCAAQLMPASGAASRIDSCGFESYSFECKACGAKLAGIIDPSDDTLLLTELTS